MGPQKRDGGFGVAFMVIALAASLCPSMLLATAAAAEDGQAYVPLRLCLIQTPHIPCHEGAPGAIKASDTLDLVGRAMDETGHTRLDAIPAPGTTFPFPSYYWVCASPSERPQDILDKNMTVTRGINMTDSRYTDCAAVYPFATFTEERRAKAQPTPALAVDDLICTSNITDAGSAAVDPLMVFRPLSPRVWVAWAAVVAAIMATVTPIEAQHHTGQYPPIQQLPGLWYDTMLTLWHVARRPSSLQELRRTTRVACVATLLITYLMAIFWGAGIVAQLVKQTGPGGGIVIVDQMRSACLWTSPAYVEALQAQGLHAVGVPWSGSAAGFEKEQLACMWDPLCAPLAVCRPDVICHDRSLMGDVLMKPENAARFHTIEGVIPNSFEEGGFWNINTMPQLLRGTLNEAILKHKGPWVLNMGNMPAPDDTAQATPKPTTTFTNVLVPFALVITVLACAAAYAACVPFVKLVKTQLQKRKQSSAVSNATSAPFPSDAAVIAILHPTPHAKQVPAGHVMAAPQQQGKAERDDVATREASAQHQAAPPPQQAKAERSAGVELQQQSKPHGEAQKPAQQGKGEEPAAAAAVTPTGEVPLGEVDAGCCDISVGAEMSMDGLEGDASTSGEWTLPLIVQLRKHQAAPTYYCCKESPLWAVFSCIAGWVPFLPLALPALWVLHWVLPSVPALWP